MGCWMKPRDARKHIAVGEKVFERIVASGELVFVHLPSGHRRFHTDDLDAYMRRCEVNGKVSAEVKKAADEILKGL